MTATKFPLAIAAGLSLVGALAACSTPADANPEPDEVADTSTDDAAQPSTGGTFADGTYSATGEYQAPSGTESVDVTITLEGGTVTAVEVVGNATDPQAILMQGQFVGGIAAVVVGKKIDELQVDKVGGSSLTSGGFNRAIDEIKADAAA